MAKGKNGSPESEVYVRIDSADALEAKKNFLEIGAAIINMQILNGKIKQEGKREVKQRGDAKSEIKSMSVLLGHLMNELPRIKVQKSEINEMESVQDPSMHHFAKPKTEVRPEVKKNGLKPKKNTLNDELLEIKRKLEGLK